VLRNVSPLAKDFAALSTRSGSGNRATMYDEFRLELGCPPTREDDLSREAGVRLLILTSADYQGYRRRLAYAFQRPFVEGAPGIADSVVLSRAALEESETAVREAEAVLAAERQSAEQAAHLLAAYQARGELITYRQATQAHLIVRRLPWVRRMLKFAASTLKVRARLTGVRSA